MRKLIWLISLLATLFSPLSLAAEKAFILNINGPIGPATQDYIERGLAKAAQEHATFIILQLNTPGGLDTAMRGINQAIIASPIPVIAYVAPTGARAASAGTFILYASHIAAMAPGTNLGAASPISLMGSSTNKAMNDAAAYIRSLAQLRGRNAEWADQAVRQGASLSAEEAKRLKVIDVVAADYPQLLQKVNGHTKEIALEKIATDWRYDFLSFLTNPNIAYLLMLAAIYGIFFELSNPGLILPGVVGIISLCLVLYAFQLMPISYAGLALIIIGIGFMMSELFISSFGMLGIGGAIAFTIGSIMLFDTNWPAYQLDWTLVATMSVITFTFFFMLISLAIKSHKKAIVSGQEALIGSEGLVLNSMNEQIIVRVLGEIWQARSSIQLQAGQKIKVTGVHGLTLTVEPFEEK
ncbi:MAG: nodulation protein NfeD [Gammaproteobacteria bacterium]|nr:MAG: nodulation protein NfeD [Gammaproteobacteria bacterium]